MLSRIQYINSNKLCVFASIIVTSIVQPRTLVTDILSVSHWDAWHRDLISSICLAQWPYHIWLHAPWPYHTATWLPDLISSQRLNDLIISTVTSLLRLLMPHLMTRFMRPRAPRNASFDESVDEASCDRHNSTSNGPWNAPVQSTFRRSDKNLH